MSQANLKNPKVEAIRRDLRQSYEALKQLVAGSLAQLSEERLYVSPGGEEWTIMENLAHIVELMYYWADEIKVLVAQPGKNFGRTQQHEGRLSAIREHRRDSLGQVSAALPGSYAYLDGVLADLNDSDLGVTGVHVRYGEQTLAWFIEEFVTGHMQAHVGQVQAALAALG
ncbi:MAG TPA: DinB family protein [Ktedonobacteraceae bacterium]|nr:DinB family protein [Ktedonobacteraceae bacterium]